MKMNLRNGHKSDETIRICVFPVKVHSSCMIKEFLFDAGAEIGNFVLGIWIPNLNLDQGSE